MKVSVYSKVRDAWIMLPVGSKVTRHDMRRLAGLVGKESKNSNLSQYLSKMVFEGRATKELSERSGLTIYVKKSHPPFGKTVVSKAKTKTEAKPRTKDLTALEVGRAVITVIKDLEAKVKEQRATMREHCGELREMVEENRRLKTMYDQAQARIIGLNKGEGLNLDDVRKTSRG